MMDEIDEIKKIIKVIFFGGIVILFIFAVWTILMIGTNEAVRYISREKCVAPEPEITRVTESLPYRDLETSPSGVKSAVFGGAWCENNTVRQEVTCDCAKNTNTPCMASCWRCVGANESIPINRYGFGNGTSAFAIGQYRVWNDTKDAIITITDESGVTYGYDVDFSEETEAR